MKKLYVLIVLSLFSCSVDTSPTGTYTWFNNSSVNPKYGDNSKNVLELNDDGSWSYVISSSNEVLSEKKGSYDFIQFNDSKVVGYLTDGCQDFSCPSGGVTDYGIRMYDENKEIVGLYTYDVLNKRISHYPLSSEDTQEYTKKTVTGKKWNNPYDFLLCSECVYFTIWKD